MNTLKIASPEPSFSELLSLGLETGLAFHDDLEPHTHLTEEEQAALAVAGGAGRAVA